MNADPERLIQEAVAEEAQQLRQQYEEELPADEDIINGPPSLSHLKDISSLASWTVSTYKPGNGVQALRHPSTDYFWQSDGPQPHFLNIHFFKRVTITYIRIYLDHKKDESYTPTKIQFWAGTGFHDLQMVTEMKPKSPRGWLGVDLSRAGGPPAFTDDEEISDEEDADPDETEDEEKLLRGIIAGRGRHRIGRGPTLRCFIVQVRILENSQNGKDTHLRGLQLFARDDLKRVSKKGVQDQTLSSSMRSSSAKKPTTQKKKGLGDNDTVNEESERLDLAIRLSRMREGDEQPSWIRRQNEWMDEPVLR